MDKLDLTLLSHQELIQFSKALLDEAETRDYKVTSKIHAADIASHERIDRARNSAIEAVERFKQTELLRIENLAVTVANDVIQTLEQAATAQAIVSRFHLSIDTIGKESGWVALITLGSDGRFQREFVKGQADYSKSNSVGTKGILNHYYLQENKLYEVSSPRSWKHTDRYLFRIEARRMIILEHEEAVRWLSTSSV